MLQFDLKSKLFEAGIACHVAWISKTLKCSRNKAHKILQGKNKHLNVTDLTVICYHLNCTPDVFFIWDSRSKYKLSEQHALRELIPEKQRSTLT